MPARSGASSSSMHTASSFGSSWIGSSPSRQSPSRSSPSRNGVRTPGREIARRSTIDKESPSQRMMLEFSQMLIRSDEDFRNRLDQASAERTKQHKEQLDKAAIEHERVRRGAELECERLRVEQELLRRKREEEQKQELERVQREKAEQEAKARQRELDTKQREEQAARQETERRKQIQEAEARLKAQKDQDDAARQQKIQQDEAGQKVREAAVAAEKARLQAPQPPPQAPKATPAPIPPTTVAQSANKGITGSTDVEGIHAQYLELHKRMKAFWKPFQTQAKRPGNPMKGPVGDLRRDLRKATGQVTVKREDSKAVITKIRGILRNAGSLGGPTVDIRPFIISHQIPTLSNEAEAQYPAMLLYAFICFEKNVMKQFYTEAASEDGRIITELSAIAASLFVDKEFTWKGVPFIDLLLAKFHHVCPMLFGISGDKSSIESAARLGWVNINGGVPNLNEYHQRMQGTACGFAAMSLRHVAAPAIPISEYWRAISFLSNMPPEKLYSGHFMVLKGLTRDFAKRFVQFYGAHAKGVLKKATIVLPKRAPKHASQTASMVSVLPDVWNAEGLTLG